MPTQKHSILRWELSLLLALFASSAYIFFRSFAYFPITLAILGFVFFWARNNNSIAFLKTISKSNISLTIALHLTFILGIIHLFSFLGASALKEKQGIPYIYFILYFLLWLMRWKVVATQDARQHDYQLKSSLLAAIVLPLTLSYLSVPNPFQSADTVTTALLPISIFKEKNLDLDEFWEIPQNPSKEEGKNQIAPSTERQAKPKKKELNHYFLQKNNGHYYSVYPIFPGLLHTISFAGLEFLGVPVIEQDILDPFSILEMHRIAERFSAALLAALSSMMIFLILRKGTTLFNASFLTFLFSFGTLHFSNSSQALWAHGFVEFFFLLGLLVLYAKKSPAQKALLLGVISACIVLCRPQAVFFSLGFLGIVFHKWHKQKKVLFYFLLSLLPGVILFFYLNWLSYGHPIFAYPLAAKVNSIKRLNNPLEGIAGLLFSPAKGLLFYTPFVVFSALAVYRQWSKMRIKVWTFVFLCTLIALAFFPKWYGGVCYGPRLLTGLSPLLVLPLVFVLKEKKGKTLQTEKSFVVFLILSLFSVLLQIPGLDGRAVMHSGSNPHIDDYPKQVWSFQRLPQLSPFLAYMLWYLYDGHIDMALEKGNNYSNEIIQHPDYDSPYIRIVDTRFSRKILTRQAQIFLPKGQYCFMAKVTSLSPKKTPKLLLFLEKSYYKKPIAIHKNKKTDFFETPITIKRPGIKLVTVLAEKNSGILLGEYIDIKKTKCTRNEEHKFSKQEAKFIL